MWGYSKEGNRSGNISYEHGSRGEWGGALATVVYVFLGYTSVIAYSAKSGEILYHSTNSPESVSGVLFTALVTILITVGGTRSTDQVNQCLTASMIGLLIAIGVLAVLFGGWSGFNGSSCHWEKVPATLPVMIFALVYHDLAPVGTSLIGSLLSFSEFFKEQLNSLNSHSPSLHIPEGGYCMTMLYRVLPLLMALAMNRKQEQETDHKMISNAGPALAGVGLCAGCLAVEQIIQDLSLLPTNYPELRVESGDYKCPGGCCVIDKPTQICLCTPRNMNL